MQITIKSIVSSLVLSIIATSTLPANAQKQIVGEDIKSLYWALTAIHLCNDVKNTEGKNADFDIARTTGKILERTLFNILSVFTMLP
jgi:hypothetical protein